VCRPDGGRVYGIVSAASVDDFGIKDFHAFIVPILMIHDDIEKKLKCFLISTEWSTGERLYGDEITDRYKLGPPASNRSVILSL
jgi:hypothetical protein